MAATAFWNPPGYRKSELGPAEWPKLGFLHSLRKHFLKFHFIDVYFFPMF